MVICVPHGPMMTVTRVEFLLKEGTSTPSTSTDQLTHLNRGVSLHFINKWLNTFLLTLSFETQAWQDVDAC